MVTCDSSSFDCLTLGQDFELFIRYIHLKALIA